MLPMLTGFKTFDLLGTFFPIGIGAGATLIIFSKLMDHALSNYHSRVYHFIIGIVPIKYPFDFDSKCRKR